MTGALPYRLDFESGEPLVEWVATDGSRFTEPFFEQTIARLRRRSPANSRARGLRTPLNALLDVPPSVPLTALIFHVSRCGSTLLTQMLAALPANIVASEPQIFDDILQLDPRNPTIAEEDRIAWLRGAARALGQRPAGSAERLFVKVACWHIFSLPLIQRAFPGVPIVFVHRHPVEVLVSLMRMPSLALVRGTVTPEQLGLTTAERDTLTREAHAAAILGALFRAAAEHRHSLVPVAYERIPGFVSESMPGCAFNDAERILLRTASAFDAKNPAESFTPDSGRKHNEASPAVLAAAARWAEPLYARWLATL